MNLKELIKIIYQKKWLVFWLTILGAVLAFDLMVIQTPKYKANSSILVVQKQIQGQDIYSISKSAQYLCQVLKEGIYSDSFFEKIISYQDEAKNQITEADFPLDLKERRKEWKNVINVRIVRDLGLMEIDVFYPDKEKAEQLSAAVTNVLTDSHMFYHGGGENVELKILDKPLVSKNPVSINLWLGTLLGALIGFYSAMLWIFRKNMPKGNFSV